MIFELLRGAYRRFGGPGLGLQPLVQRLFQPERVELDGFHLYLDPNDRMVSFTLAMNGEWAPFETSLFRQLIRPGQTVLDVGAHIGYFTLLASTLVGPEGKVYAFEPEPANRALLERSVAGNGRRNVVVVAKGVSDKAERLSLHRHAGNTGKHSLFAASDLESGGVAVETVALGPWLAETGARPDFIKLDVEGAEWRALEGMEAFLSDKRPLTLLLEYFPEAIRRSGREPASWLGKLESLGFRLSHVDEKARALRPLKADEIARTFTASSCDLLCQREGQTLTN